MKFLQRLAIYSFAVAFLAAQTFDAQLTGLVTDAQGAAVPSVHLTATNIATGVSASADSNGAGVYRFLTLPAATYRVSASAPGFKRFEQSRVTLQVADIATLNVKLDIGDTTQEVVVSDTPPALETQSATLGQVVTTRSIQNLPLNIRDPLALVALTAGVTLGPNFGNGGASDVGRNYFKSDFNVGGGRSGSQEILLDGAPDVTPDINRAIIDPPVDSVQEFKVQINTYDAEFGRTTGGVVNIITKSGSNTLHGVAYDFERNSALDANNFFNNRAGLPNLSFIRHQFGANASGPVIKNKIFIFGDYEGLRQGYPITFTSTVPNSPAARRRFLEDLYQRWKADPDFRSQHRHYVARWFTPANSVPKQYDSRQPLRSGFAEDLELLSAAQPKRRPRDRPEQLHSQRQERYR